jgi:hypothetical protein
MIPMKKILNIIVFTFFFFTTNSFPSITKYFGSSKIKFDESGVINFIRYLEGTFHAEDIFLDRAAKLMSPLYYAVSEDGKVGYGWFCRSLKSNDCFEDFSAYKVVEFCKEYAQKKCYIFANRDQIVWNNTNIKVTDLSFAKNVELFKKLDFYDEKSARNVNENNYLNYVHLDHDKCLSKKISQDYSSFRGASINCMLPGQFEQTINDKIGSGDLIN